VDRRERERILKQGAVRRDDPRDQAEGRTLARDLEGSPVVGRRLNIRLRNFRPSEDSYLASLGGPLPYMVRLRKIEEESDWHGAELHRRWCALAAGCDGNPDAFLRAWLRQAERWNFAAVNELIDKHNRYYPAEARLPMDPRTGDFILVAGKHYRKPLLDAGWVLERFPPVLVEARRAA
jgi:hypothetical protein